MHEIIPPLTPGDVGAAAANLVKVMLFFVEHGVISGSKTSKKPTAKELSGLVTTAKKELASSTFGPATKQLVSYFQRQVGLGDQLRGAINKRTAAKINEWLEYSSNKDSTKETTSITVVQGHVSDKSTGKPAVNVEVSLFDRDDVPSTPLGKTRSDQAGFYRIELSADSFRRLTEPGGSRLISRACNDKGQQIGQSRPVTNVSDTTELDIEITPLPYRVQGIVRDAADHPVPEITVKAFLRGGLRSEQPIGEGRTDRAGRYEIPYSIRQFGKSNQDSANLVIKAYSPEDTLLAASPILFNAPLVADLNLTIPVEAFQPAPIFEKIKQGLTPWLEDMSIAELEENSEYQDLSFLSGETGVDSETLDRFVLAHKLAQQGIQAEFWFVLLNTTASRFPPIQQPPKRQPDDVLDSFASLNAATVRRVFDRGFSTNEISDVYREKVDAWVDAFLTLMARRMVSGTERSSFIKLALDDAGIVDGNKQLKFAQLFQEHGTVNPAVLETLAKNKSFKKSEIADVQTSFRLAELTRGDFSVVKAIKEWFDVREPNKIRTLARKSTAEWVNLIATKHRVGEITLPLEMSSMPEQVSRVLIESSASMLEQQFREAFPTSAFAGGLELALHNGGAKGLRQAEELKRFLDLHEEFEFLHTPIDQFLKDKVRRDFKPAREDNAFRTQLKAIQRVFKLVPRFEATDALLADGLHSAQQIYRLGQSKFVRRYEQQPGFTTETARRAWNRAADTHAAVLTIVADLKGLEAESLPAALKNNDEALSQFPNWDNLFSAGDLCECEDCQSVLSPAAYYADLLMFLKDRNAKNPSNKVKDILLARRPDLGFLELNCANTLTEIPYIDVVCEVLERAVDVQGENDLVLLELDSIPSDPALAKSQVATAFKTAFSYPENEAKENIELGEDFTLSQVTTTDRDRWVVHGENVTYLLKKNTQPYFFAEILRNAKASAAELRAYPQYINPKSYEKLRLARYPLSLPFDLFGEEVRAALQKINLQRWELMRTLRGGTAPDYSPTDLEIAAEYFDISVWEKDLILMADANEESQKIKWGEQGTDWLDKVGNVKNFLKKTSLEYNDLLALLDLKFITPNSNPDGEIDHLIPSCDTAQKRIRGLDAVKLDRIHRFLRLWRRLNGWKLWELDRAIRCKGVGHKNDAGEWLLDEQFLISLYYFARLKTWLGPKTTVEQLCALFGNLNTETRFIKQHDKREDGLYQTLFLNPRLTSPLDPAFKLDASTGDLPSGGTISGHQSVVLGGLGISGAELVLFKELTKPASPGDPYITDTLNLQNLSFLWRHARLSKLLLFTAEDWKSLLRLTNQSLFDFASPRTAWEFVEKVNHLKAGGFTMDELLWILAADRTAKAATKEADATRFLSALRKNIQTIRGEYDPAKYDFLLATPPTDVINLTALLTSLLQILNRDEAATQAFLSILNDEISQETRVDGLPEDFVDFPPEIKKDIRIKYDKSTKKLRFTGVMTAEQKGTLETSSLLSNVIGIAAYKAAIQELYDGPRLVLKFFEPVFTAPLAKLPEAVDFKTLPPPLAQKVSFDAEQHVLRCADILSRADKTALDALSADASYRTAVSNLFIQPSTGTFPSGKIWLQDGDLGFPLRNLADPTKDNLAKNLATAVTKALPYLRRIGSENVVVQLASAELEITEAMTRMLMTHYQRLPHTLLNEFTEKFGLTTDVVDYATHPTTFDGWFWANRVALAWTKWKLTLADIEKVIDLADKAKLLDVGKLPLKATDSADLFDQWLRTGRLLRLRDTFSETDSTFLDLLERLNATVPPEKEEFAKQLHRLSDAWSDEDITDLTNKLNLTYPADYLLAETWERLRRAFFFIGNLNASADTATQFALPGMTLSHAQMLKELMRSKFGQETWLALSAELQDALRERKRDALAAYLLAQATPTDAPSGKWENANDLYAYYLLDVEMASCQLTSRLVQASGSVQLFVQRCFLGLEPDVQVNADGPTGDSAWHWWKWMRKYQVWVANRKVFLWPENWIEPELKKDRSSFFKDLETELFQNDIDQYTVETAFMNYLGKLKEVAQLEIAGFYQEDVNRDQTIIHVFGRTPKGEPHRYYYRRYDYRQWTPWEIVDLDIQGDYLIPAVVSDSLILLWPVITEIPDEQKNREGIPIPPTGANIAQLKPTAKRLKIQFAMSEYSGKWSPKRTSKEFVQSTPFTDEVTTDFLTFPTFDRVEERSQFSIGISAIDFLNPNAQFLPVNGVLAITNSSGILEVLFGGIGIDLLNDFTTFGFPTLYPAAARAQQKHMKFIEKLAQTDDLTLTRRYWVKGDIEEFMVFNATPWKFTLSTAWQLSYLDKFVRNGQYYFDIDNPSDPLYTRETTEACQINTWLPFFYDDPTRTFFVLPNYNKELIVPTNYYPEIKGLLNDIEKIAAEHAKQWADAIFVSQPQKRNEYERILQTEFPRDGRLPGYPWRPEFGSLSDDMYKSLLTQHLNRGNHKTHGDTAFHLFQQSNLQFKNFYHPFAKEFIRMLSDPNGIATIMSRTTQLKDKGFDFNQTYQPSAVVNGLFPRETIDFTSDGAYSSYNWELFFHAPLLIASQLSKNQRFEEAREWYHFIFNPLGVESTLPGGSLVSKYWITKPFFQATETDFLKQRVDNILRMLAGDTTVPGYSEETKKALEGQVLDWRIHPFEPHRIANYRTVAYQKTVVMKYLDNLIAWGDYLFRQDSMESINEATQLYVLAAEILGPRPKTVPPQAKPPLESFNELEGQFDKFSNALVQVENLVPLQGGNDHNEANQAQLPMLYFCVPHNDKLISYWDQVADRLYKIRHCMNIEGVVRHLALFEPPIDPAALVKAAASGADLGSVLADLNAPLPPYRFNMLLQKANEVCNDVKALGGALFAALEKKDSEAMALIRQAQEVRLLESVKAVRETQLAEAKENLEGIKRSKSTIEVRRNYYREIAKITSGEQLSLDKQAVAFDHQKKAQEYNIFASMLGYLPNLTIGFSGFGGSPHVNAQWGIGNIISALQAAAGSETHLSNAASFDATRASTLAGYERRFDDWKLQERLADKELDQIEKQIASAELRIAIAEKELANHLIQIENAMAIDTFMRSKYTNQELYQWQIGQISNIYFQSYKLAYDLAKRAERCFRFELGLQDSTYIQFGYWDSLKKGLLSGEKLQYDLRRLEVAYLEQNRREFELTKHISLAQLDPKALVKLRETGRCFIDLAEELFDLDFPGHYFRRMKSVSLTLPCVVGPYTTVSCTLRLVKNSIRINTSGDSYPRNIDEQGLPADDSRFIERTIPVRAIAASTGQNDSGVFELNFRDDRYLPFEGAGVISQWSLELFSDLPSNNQDFGKPLRQFDYNTIPDAVLHIKYTAREDAGPFKNRAITHLREYFAQSGSSRRMLDLRKEFPTQWHRFLEPANAATGNLFELEISQSFFRMLDQQKTLKLTGLSLIARCKDLGSYEVVMTPPLIDGANKVTMVPLSQFGGLHVGVKGDRQNPLNIDIKPGETWQLKMTRPDGGNLQAGEVEEFFLVMDYTWG